MSAKLILISGKGPREQELAAFNTLGRHPDNTIPVLDKIVSKQHCRIALGPQGKYVIRDLGSLNGTYINDERRTEVVLEDGDRITLGNTILEFRGEEAAPTQLKKVTMMAGQVQSRVRSRVDATSHFLPVAQIDDVAVLGADYEKLRVAHELSQKLSVDNDLDALLQKIVDETFFLIRADRAVILLCDADTNELEPRYVRQKNEDDEIRLSESILAEVRNNKAAVLSFDASVDERFKAAKSIIMQGIRSTMCVPLLYNDEFLGAMHMDSMLTTGAFTEKDLQLFQGIATQAAVAIQNQRLAEKIEAEASTRAQFQRLLSPNLVDEIVSGAIKLDQAGTDLEVTMLFADIRGFTSMSERHAPSQLVKILNDYFEVMVDVLFSHGGTLDKYVGDGIIGLFGAPVAQPDSPIRAVRCSLDMLKALSEFNRLRAEQGLEAVQIGIGVNTGPVIAGAIGSSRTLQYTVIGDAVNTAARLCKIAKPNEIIVSQSTFHRCREEIVVETMEPVRVKGKSAPLPIYRAVGTRESADSLARSTQATPSAP